MKKIGILLYDDSLIGGAENVAIKLSQELSQKYEVHMISIFQQKSNRIPENIVHTVICSELKSITFNLFDISKKLKLYLTNQQIEVLIGITAGINTVAILATLGTKIKTIYCEHSNLENKTYGKKHELRQWIGAKYMDKIVTLTERDKENFFSRYKLPKEKVICIPNWFDVNYSLDETYQANEKKIISVGRLEKVKGYDMLVKVAKIVFEKHSDWSWDIYGDGKFKQEIQKGIDKANLQKNVFLKGNVADIKDRYKNYSFYVMTSYYEGLPLSLLEAQNSKLPIISFDCATGPAEIVENNVNGYLIPCYDIDLMADKIRDLIKDIEKRKEFSNNSQINFEKFKKEKILEQWINLIQKV